MRTLIKGFNCSSFNLILLCDNNCPLSDFFIFGFLPPSFGNKAGSSPTYGFVIEFNFPFCCSNSSDKRFVSLNSGGSRKGGCPEKRPRHSPFRNLEIGGSIVSCRISGGLRPLGAPKSLNARKILIEPSEQSKKPKQTSQFTNSAGRGEGEFLKASHMTSFLHITILEQCYIFSALAFFLFV